MSQLDQEATFHIDHVIPRAAGGSTMADDALWHAILVPLVFCFTSKGFRRFVR